MLWSTDASLKRYIRGSMAPLNCSLPTNISNSHFITSQINHSPKHLHLHTDQSTMLSSILTLTVAALVALTPALGRVSDVYFPASAQLGQVVSVNISVTGYIQQWADLDLNLGVVDASEHCGTCVGTGLTNYGI